MIHGPNFQVNEKSIDVYNFGFNDTHFSNNNITDRAKEITTALGKKIIAVTPHEHGLTFELNSFVKFEDAEKVMELYGQL